MPTIALNPFLVLCDSLAQQARTLADAYSTGAIAGGEPISGNGMGAGPPNNQATIMATGDIDVAAGLAASFELAPSAPSLISGAFLRRIAALNAHVGGIAAFLAANNARVDPRFVTLLWRVPPAQVFPPAVDPVASFAATGAGAGSFTHAAGVDTTQYGPAALQLVTTDLIGASPIVATLTLTTLAGASVAKVVNIPANTANATAFAVDAGAIAYTDCTGISITGGAAGDAFKVRTILERTIAL